MSDFAAPTPSLGLTDAPRMFISPGAVFHRIAADARYGWTFGTLLLLTTLVGWATVQTGLIGREVDRRTRTAVATLEREQVDLLSRAELSERMEKIRKSAEFTKLLARGGAVLAAPVGLAASLMLIAAALFAVVALVGNKPEYQTLMSICVHAAVVDVLAAGLRLGMMLCYRTIEVDTSLGLLVARTEETRVLHDLLSAVDPFRVWFWIWVALGLVMTGQLSRRATAVTCSAFWFAAVGARMLPALAGKAPPWAP